MTSIPKASIPVTAPGRIDGVQRPDGTFRPRAHVPCGGCRLCCQKNVIMLFPDEGDVVESYDHEIRTIGPGLTGPVLKHKPNGDCIYLGPEGCTIHDRAPVCCRVFDCRDFFLMHSRGERRNLIKRGLAGADVFRRGRDLLKQERA